MFVANFGFGSGRHGLLNGVDPGGESWRRGEFVASDGAAPWKPDNTFMYYTSFHWCQCQFSLVSVFIGVRFSLVLLYFEFLAGFEFLSLALFLCCLDWRALIIPLFFKSRFVH